jgi:hypothetical protein
MAGVPAVPTTRRLRLKNALELACTKTGAKLVKVVTGVIDLLTPHSLLKRRWRTG